MLGKDGRRLPLQDTQFTTLPTRCSFETLGRWPGGRGLGRNGMHGMQCHWQGHAHRDRLPQEGAPGYVTTPQPLEKFTYRYRSYNLITLHDGLLSSKHQHWRTYDPGEPGSAPTTRHAAILTGTEADCQLLAW